MTNLLTDSQLHNLSILADQAGDDRVFALCGRAYNGDRAARRELTVAWNAARARAAARRAAKTVSLCDHGNPDTWSPGNSGCAECDARLQRHQIRNDRGLIVGYDRAAIEADIARNEAARRAAKVKP